MLPFHGFPSILKENKKERELKACARTQRKVVAVLVRLLQSLGAHSQATVLHCVAIWNHLKRTTGTSYPPKLGWKWCRLEDLSFKANFSVHTWEDAEQKLHRFSLTCWWGLVFCSTVNSLQHPFISISRTLSPSQYTGPPVNYVNCCRKKMERIRFSLIYIFVHVYI